MTDDSGATRTFIKVPQITLYFWLVKILTTGAGESASDFLSERFNPAVAAIVGGIGLAIALVIQFRTRRYQAWAYWFAVTMVAVFGTMAADVLHGGLKISYLVSMIVLAIVLIVIFAAWYRSERTLSIHSICTRRREAFYWATVIATFALGTAAGDWTATTLGWGYLQSGVMFSIAIAVVGATHFVWKRATGGVLTFWLAYILTRPLGASFADWAGKARNAGGLGYGDGTVSAVTFIVILALVGYLAVSRKDVAAGSSA